MADLIKKIKIKKQDGTFTDYIPIGAEAQNVSTSDGESVQLKLNKKPYYYNSIADIKADTKLKVGDMAVTLGYYEVNDGGGATYKITNEESETDYQEELENGLYASLINNLGNNYYDEITYTKERYYDTDCYFAIIPKYDQKNELIDVYVDKDETVSPLQYAQKNHTTLTINGGLTKLNSQQQWIQSIVIGNGEVLNGEAQGVTIWDYNLYIGFNENRELLEFVANETTAEEMIQAGVKNGYMVFYRFLNNGELEEHTDAPNWNVKAPRMDIGIKSNGDILIFACDGRTVYNTGIDDEQAATLMANKGCIKAWRTDGGGSTSLNIKENKINRNIDEDGTSDRKIHITLNVKKPTKDEKNANLYGEISKQIQLLNEQIRNDFNNKNSSIYLEVEHASRNNIVAADTYQLAKLNGKYRHNNSILTLKDENNNIIGFTVKTAGLVRVMFQADFESNAPGNKGIKITKGDSDTLERFTRFDVSESSTVTKQIIAETVINNPNEEDLPIKLWIKSNNVGDRFVRMSAYAEYLGTAES